MKIKNVCDKYKTLEEMLRCPICEKSGIILDTGSFVCENNHCFDLSSKGYINFVPNQSQRLVHDYTEELFEARRAIFDDGYYEVILNSLCKLAADYSAYKMVNVLDVGCGEGYYSIGLNRRLDKSNIIGLDIIKSAVIIASRANPPVYWIVGNLNQIPLKDNSVDIIINVLTPANYSEFKRVLKPGGIVLKVIPGSNYLREIREISVNRAYNNSEVKAHFSDNLILMGTDIIDYTLPVNNKQANYFVQMTPLTTNFDFDSDTLDLNISEITINLEILVGTF